MRGAGIGQNPYLPFLSNQRARERSDYEPLGVGICLGVVGVSEPEDVARELDDRVLKAGSGGDENCEVDPRPFGMDEQVRRSHP